MKTRFLSDRTGARASRAAASSLLALSALGAGVGSALAAPGGGGAVWTTGDPCTTSAAQNDNLYAPGDTVYVRGANFAASSGFAWDISGQPGGASGDPGLSVVSGASTTDADGAFCVAAYVVAADDWGVYSVELTQGRTSKNDNYRVEGDGTTAEDPADETIEEPADVPTNEPTVDEPTPSVVDDASATDETTDPVDPPTVKPPFQAVLGEVSVDARIELPATDTVSDVATGAPSLVLILGLAGLAGTAVLFTPSRRREPDATE